MFYALIAPPDDDEVFDIPANRGYAREVVHGHLERLATEGHTVTAEPISDKARQDAYYSAASNASRLGIQVSRVFGSRKQSGLDRFGRQIPALLVYESEGGKLVDVYPHSHKHDPTDATIVDYFASVT